MLDYAHNPSAYQNIMDLVKHLGHKRRLFVFDVVGDRRDEDIREICRMIAGSWSMQLSTKTRTFEAGHRVN
jgi:cyanophycin synthetase